MPTPTLNPNLNSKLNPEQQAAVELEPNRNGLILSGAGTGKTRVLAYRVAHLITHAHVQPHEILILTFTNKASREMRHRVQALLNRSQPLPWAGTFHSIGRRFIERHPHESGWQKPFQIMDSNDQFGFIKKMLVDSDLQPEKDEIKAIQSYINSKKENGLRAGDLDPNTLMASDRTRYAWYKEYEDRCRENRLLDFAELIICPTELFAMESIASRYQENFKAILIDEFQDTSPLQYQLLKLLSGSKVPLFAVGDDDQSIYGWRGADVMVLQHFQEQLNNVALVKLEQNYRSTGNILNCANKLIRNNKDRLGKQLWTEQGDGELISCITLRDEHQEANEIANKIQALIEQDTVADEIAVLYRLNRLSRLIEQTLLSRHIPCQVYGGLSFFAREEIKHIVAYLRLARNPNDAISLARIINVPQRGIGEKTVELIRNFAQENNCNDIAAIKQMLAQDLLPKRVTLACQGFLDIIETTTRLLATEPLFEVIKKLGEISGIIEYYREREKKSPLEIDRIENIGELVTAARDYGAEYVTEFATESEYNNLELVDSFLDNCALGDATQSENQDIAKVQLMTVHSAKGLEFNHVFIAGLEDGTFPHQGFDGTTNVEEERRLCYVALTRARSHLTLFNCLSRTIFGSHTPQLASRFFKEMPNEYLIRYEAKNHAKYRGDYRGGYQRNYQPGNQSGVQSGGQSGGTSSSNELSGDGLPPNGLPPDGLLAGTRVSHRVFGTGTIIATAGHDDEKTVHVQFARTGKRWLMLKYAGLEIL